MTTPAEYFAQGLEAQQEAARLFARANWSPTVQVIPYDHIDPALASTPRVVISFGTHSCAHCAVLLPELERLAAEERMAVYRHDVYSTHQAGIGLSPWEDPNAPPSQTGLYVHRLPVTLYFEDGEFVRRAYGEDIDLGELTRPEYRTAELDASVGDVEVLIEGDSEPLKQALGDAAEVARRHEGGDEAPASPASDLGPSYDPPTTLEDAARTAYDDGYDCGRANRWEPPPRKQALERKRWEEGFAHGKADAAPDVGLDVRGLSDAAAEAQAKVIEQQRSQDEQ